VAQAGEVADRLAALGAETELVPIVTSGDRGAAAAASPAGLKGLFVAEIVQALLAGDVDLAVHSAKDLPSQDEPGVVVAAVPERADPFDVLVLREPGELSPGARVGTSSLRRKAQLLRSRPELVPTDIRGNVDTRLRNLEAGEVDALLLAAAGLVRLGVEVSNALPLPLEEMVPAPGQGALAVQARAGDEAVGELCRQIDHQRSRVAFEAERMVVARLGGGCALPLGAYAEQRDTGVRLLAVVIRPDGSDLAWAQAEAAGPVEVATEVVRILADAGAEAILAELRT
jgi:hydroxymethylbilane synthase